MYVYMETEKGLFTVGFFKPNGDWCPESDYDNRQDAAMRINFLNGGPLSY